MSQADTILARLQAGETITPARALELTGSLACHSRIAELRARGYRIECKMRTGNGRRWGEYRLVGQLDLLSSRSGI